MPGAPFPIQSLLPMFAYFAIGLFLRRRGVASGDDADFLFRVVFLVTLPALVFLSISQAELSRQTALLPVAGFSVNLACTAVAILVGRLRGYPAPVIGAMAVSAGIINMGYTFPFLLGTLGREALAVAILFDVGNAAFVAFCVYPIAEYFGHDRPGFSLVSVRRVMLSPIFIAIAAALFVNLSGAGVAPVVATVLRPLGEATLPLMLITVGMSFSGLAGHVSEAAAAIAVRMLFGGMLAALLSWQFGFQGLTAAVVVVSAAAPVGGSAAAVASVSGLNRDVAVNAVSISAMIGLVTTSVLLYATSYVYG
jgi:predicted permease